MFPVGEILEVALKSELLIIFFENYFLWCGVSDWSITRYIKVSIQSIKLFWKYLSLFTDTYIGMVSLIG